MRKEIVLEAQPEVAVAISREAFAEGGDPVAAVCEWQEARERNHRRVMGEVVANQMDSAPPGWENIDGAPGPDNAPPFGEGS